MIKLARHPLKLAASIGSIATVLFGLGFLIGDSRDVVETSVERSANEEEKRSVLIDGMIQEADTFDFCGSYGRFVFGRSGSRKLKEIEVLRVSDHRFTLEESNLVSDLKSLLVLHLRNSEIPEKQLRRTLDRGELNVLVLENVPVTTYLVDSLSTSSRLYYLGLFENGLSDDDLLRISDNKSLRYLVLDKETALRVADRIFSRGNRRLRVLTELPRFYLPEFD